MWSQMTLADKITVSRLGLIPLIGLSYVLLPGLWALGVVAGLCLLAELTDWLDGRVARSRNEVSDFGKLADPFCDVMYRMSTLLIMTLPIAVSPLVAGAFPVGSWFGPQHGPAGTVALAPWLAVFLQVMREFIAGSLRAMAATKGLVLAARWSGKIKATVQGVAMITTLLLPVIFGGWQAWHLQVGVLLFWVAAVLSTYSIIEYLVVNQAVLQQLVQRRPRNEQGVIDADNEE
jgi:CDP-diacylglycerol--glycerol-3-phosphate 3-phosphatidyltransferase